MNSTCKQLLLLFLSTIAFTSLYSQQPAGKVNTFAAGNISSAVASTSKDSRQPAGIVNTSDAGNISSAVASTARDNQQPARKMNTPAAGNIHSAVAFTSRESQQPTGKVSTPAAGNISSTASSAARDNQQPAGKVNTPAAGNIHSAAASTYRLNWKVSTPASGNIPSAAVSTAGFPDKDWIPAIVPGTVFYSYVKAGKEKDPDYADNIYKVDKSVYNKPFWYRTEFPEIKPGNRQHLWLQFNGINKRADIYVNGQYLGSLHGLMQRGIYDITSYLQKGHNNAIAVLITPPRWDPEHNHGLANWESPTYLSSGSWDWMPAVPGLNSGITDTVALTITGPVRIADPWIRTDLPDTNHAAINISATVQNSSSAPVSGQLRAVINPGNITAASKTLTIPANSKQDISLLAKEIAQLNIQDPRLWWPNGYGTPFLYSCQLSFETDNVVSDQTQTTFGIRSISADTTALNGPMRLYINGVPILIKGGNWGMSDYLLKVRGSDYEPRIRLHQAMNFNMIRNWTGEVTDEDFYKYCDQYGIMVWDDFWLNNFGAIDSLDMFKDNVIDKIKKFRNHPAIVIWCGANEGVPGGSVHSDLSKIISSAISELDGNYCLYIPRSNAGVANPNFSIHGGSKNLSGSGIWAHTDPKTYFTDPHNGYLFSQNSWGLRSELGTATFVNAESFKRFMPQEYWRAPVPDDVKSSDNMWAKHFFSTSGELGGGANPVKYINDINSRYGKATSLEDFCKKAQLFNLETMKAMFEAWNDHMWQDASGMLIWMSQSAYPSMIWQTYDYYYDLTGAYFGARLACEPVHIQWNPATCQVKVINNTIHPLTGISAEATVYNSDGKNVAAYTKKMKLNAAATATTTAFTMLTDSTAAQDLSPVHFLRLKLYTENGQLLSENTYMTGKKYLDYASLAQLPAVKKNIIISKPKTSGNNNITCTISNTSNTTAAVGIRVQLLDKAGKQILPAIISHSYFTLMQGEQQTVTIAVKPEQLKNGYRVVAEAFNN